MKIPGCRIKFSWLGCFFLFLGAVFSVGFHHPDEHFQIIEFALEKLGRFSGSELPWEFKAEMRPALQPFLAMFCIKGCETLGMSDPFIMALFLRLISAGLAFYAMFRLCNVLLAEYLETNERFRKWFLFLSFLNWFWCYSAIRFSSENWSASFFVLGFALLIEKKQTWRSFLTIGLFWGLAIVFRLQLIAMVGGIMCWLVLFSKVKWTKIFVTGFGIVTGIGVGVLADRCFYGHWVITYFNYFIQNIVLHKAAGFGISPWYYYFIAFFNCAIPPFSLLMIIAVLAFLAKFWKHPVAWAVVPFILLHFGVGHKEVRFLFPIFAFFPFMVVVGLGFLEVLLDKFGDGTWGQWHKTLVGKWIIGLFVVTNFIALIGAMLKPASDKMGLYEAIYHYKKGGLVYFIDQNPYQENDLYQHFYARKNLNLVHISKEEVVLNKAKGDCDFSLKPNVELAKGIVIFQMRNLPDENWRSKHKLIYSSYPAWVMVIDFNGWVERSDGYWVYEV